VKVAVVASAHALRGRWFQRHAQISFNELVAQPGGVELHQGWTEHRAVSQGDDVFALTLFVVSSPDVLVSDVIFE
jgi:hypothetical protein